MMEVRSEGNPRIFDIKAKSNTNRHCRLQYVVEDKEVVTGIDLCEHKSQPGEKVADFRPRTLESPFTTTQFLFLALQFPKTRTAFKYYSKEVIDSRTQKI
jgi:hypothetical protein